jgi:hypothetical protein
MSLSTCCARAGMTNGRSPKSESMTNRETRKGIIDLWCLAFVTLLVPPALGQDLDPQTVLDHRMVVTDIRNAQPLLEELAEWASAIAADGRHYGPGVFHDGPNTIHWFEGQAVWSMAAALPYLEAQPKAALVEYLKRQIADHLCTEQSLQFEQSGRIDYGGGDGVSWRVERNAAALERIYALYLYARNSGDLDTARAHWPFMRKLYIEQSARADRRPLVIERRDYMTFAVPAPNSRLIGHLGAYRMARMMGDSAVAEQAARLFIDEAPRQLKLVRAPAIRQDAFGRPTNMLRFGRFDPLIPELARYIRAHALEDARYTLSEAQRQLPWWFLSSYNIAGTGGGCRDRGPFGPLLPTGDEEADQRAQLWYESDSSARVGDENNFMNPGFSYQVYQAKALVLMEDLDELKRTRPWLNEWRSQPWYRDMQGLQNLLTLIARHGTIAWEAI